MGARPVALLISRGVAGGVAGVLVMGRFGTYQRMPANASPDCHAPCGKGAGWRVRILGAAVRISWLASAFANPARA